MVSDFSPRPLKKLFTANKYGTSFLDASGLRDIEVEAVTKMLVCSTRIIGVKEFGCDNASCTHVKFITNACHSRASPSCGKKATDLWIAAQLNRLPDCDWIHLVFPLPDSLWPLFEFNRWLLKDLRRLAVDNLLNVAPLEGERHGSAVPMVFMPGSRLYTLRYVNTRRISPACRAT
ncbi:transposase zinc-binding domain-containing protein, partial [Enterobacter asburiae]|uniref:transposase zinc-binding domain-containing protein n=1 Tax=Enterobacter asburiae TaxID=61645 RepID=UPI001F317AFA